MATLLLLLLQAADVVEIRACVESLEADSIEKRTDAFKRLLEFGDAARAPLERAIRQLDNEGALRARELLKRLDRHEAAVRREAAHWLSHAFARFDEGGFADCIRFSEAVLAIDPDYGVALAVREKAQKAQHASPTPRDSRFPEWAAETSILTGTIPEMDTFRCPEVRRWRQMQERVWTIITLSLETSGNCGGRGCVLNLLRAIKVSVMFEQLPLEDLLAFLRDNSGPSLELASIMFDEARVFPQVGVDAADAKLWDKLWWALRLASQRYCMTEDGEILITTARW